MVKLITYPWRLSQTIQQKHLVSMKNHHDDYTYLNTQIINILQYVYTTVCLQCFDAVGWAAGRASGL